MKFAVLVVMSSIVVSGCTTKLDTAVASQAIFGVMNGQGEMAGEVTANSVILQSRLTSTNRLVDGDMPGAVGVARFDISTSSDFVASQTTEWLQAVPEHDYIVKKRVTQLSAGTPYYYRLVYGPSEKNVQVGPRRSFKTLQGSGAAAEVNFVVVTGMNYNNFYSGARAYKGPDREQGYPALKTILEAKPDFFVGTGDNVYYDSGPKHAQKPEDMRRFWHEQFVQPRMIELMGQVATYWQKDDHDTRWNDADNTGNVEPLPALGKAIFDEQMPVVVPGDKNFRPYRTYRVSKDLQIWMTEGREYRSPSMSEEPNKTLWGAAQLAWLKQTLLESDATFKILISPGPMVGPEDRGRSEFGGTLQRGAKPPANPPGIAIAELRALRAQRLEGHDDLKRDNMTAPWGYKRERDDFFTWLRANDMLANNFYVVCGDRHWQYHSIDPSGVEEFSSGAIIDENSRLGRAPGDPLGNDPKALIKQPYTSKERSGGFLKVTVQPGPKPMAFFRFYDEHGVELYGVTKEATASKQ